MKTPAERNWDRAVAAEEARILADDPLEIRPHEKAEANVSAFRKLAIAQRIAEYARESE